MNPPEFKVGDVVELMSGGPPMTVEGTEATADGYLCRVLWHGDDAICRGTIPARCLTLFVLDDFDENDELEDDEGEDDLEDAEAWKR